jgi:hypothetical protein
MEQKWKTNTIEDLGLSIIAVSSRKTPFKPWEEYQTKISPISEWYSHYLNQGTVGIITGRISGNLEIIDVDVKNDPQKTIMDELIALIPPELYKRLIIQTTPNHGFHLIYRCPDTIIEGNLKLALHSNRSVIIETRGEGGYFCTSKVNNRVIQGRFNLEALELDIPVITSEERTLLLEIARSLTRYFPQKTDSKSNKPYQYKEPAINDFNNKYPVIDLFTKHGWEIVNEDDEKCSIKRPGSSAVHSGYYFKDSQTFFCFSTSTGFESAKPYNHFQVLQVLEGDNDYNKTIRLLPDYGFPVKEKSTKITSDDIANFLNQYGVRYDTFIQDLTLSDKVIEELDYNTVYIDLKNHFDKEIPRTRFEEIIKSRYITTINPIEKYIQEHIHLQPTGSFDKLMDCLELKNPTDRDAIKFFLTKWYVGMIGQACGGEYPNEFFLAFLSIEQGIGKSSLLRNNILPKELQRYRAEHALTFDDDFQVIMSQTMLVVDDEMDGHTYNQEKTFKNVLSSKEITLRRKYDRRISTIKRRCSFAGSGNNLNVVKEAGNRRIIPIEIRSIDFEKLAQVDLDDLFMEAHHLFAAGFHYSYEHSDKNMIQKLCSAYVQKSDVELIIEEYIETPENEDDTYFLSTLDLVTTLISSFPYFDKRINVISIGKLMNERGFKSVRKGRIKSSGYEISSTSRVIELWKIDRNGDQIVLG